MRFLRSVVQSLVRSMLYSGDDLSFRCTVALQLICDDHARNILQAFQQLAEETLGGFFVPATLDQDVKDVAMVIIYLTQDR